MSPLKLPFWLAGPELTRLKDAAQAWWGKVIEWLRWPLLQMDAEQCHLTILDLLAWQRDITRYRDEPESLYRLRVKHAFINAVDAGSTAGLKRILRRLGVGYIEIDERLADRDWDVVLLRLSDSQLSESPELLRVLIQQYGRTCRRYDFVSITPVTLRLAAVDFNDDQQTLVATL
ncbi:MAG: phage tail protein [Paucimonas sp.]|jgi:hypothetical protein|uniref:phage tail protein n=1 Tax=Pantoea sp. Cy-639 TaxID=2608360 RepID=UPI001423B628|nr:phage tail protein [Pantoea sp. Cy-639]MDR2305710.1 phage tail protein [Paucimonas sp.]NIF19371.1 phage tail protein [Pantoea sp. Cy-639]